MRQNYAFLMNAPPSRKGRKETITFFKNTANMESSPLSSEPLSREQSERPSPCGTHATLFHRVNLSREQSEHLSDEQSESPRPSGTYAKLFHRANISLSLNLSLSLSLNLNLNLSLSLNRNLLRPAEACA